jgi:DNA-binding NarL/FixJ family response regulator
MTAMDPSRPTDPETRPEAHPGPGGPAVTVIVVDDSPAYLAAARAVVEATPGFELVGTATSAAAAVETIDRSAAAPDLVLVDVNLGDDSGLDVARAVAGARPSTRVLLVSTLLIDDLPPDARHCGAAGYLPKVVLGPVSLRAAAAGAYDWAP